MSSVNNKKNHFFSVLIVCLLSLSKTISTSNMVELIIQNGTVKINHAEKTCVFIPYNSKEEQPIPFKDGLKLVKKRQMDDILKILQLINEKDNLAMHVALLSAECQSARAAAGLAPKSLEDMIAEHRSKNHATTVPTKDFLT